MNNENENGYHCSWPAVAGDVWRFRRGTGEPATGAAAGTITASGVGGSPMDYRAQLAEKADAQGARAYRIIEARTGDNWHATAEIYK